MGTATAGGQNPFGRSSDTSAPTSNPFSSGASAPAFGSSSAFGGSPPNSFGSSSSNSNTMFGSSGFGKTSSLSSSTTTTTFGGFGGSASTFGGAGAGGPATAFGGGGISTSTSFGGGNGSTTFGSGAKPATTFGGSAAASPAAFGGSKTTSFGKGASPAPAFGSGTAFGGRKTAPTSPVFGGSSSNKTTFGGGAATTTNTTFGKSTQKTGFGGGPRRSSRDEASQADANPFTKGDKPAAGGFGAFGGGKNTTFGGNSSVSTQFGASGGRGFGQHGKGKERAPMASDNPFAAASSQNTTPSGKGPRGKGGFGQDGASADTSGKTVFGHPSKASSGRGAFGGMNGKGDGGGNASEPRPSAKFGRDRAAAPPADEDGQPPSDRKAPKHLVARKSKGTAGRGMDKGSDQSDVAPEQSPPRPLQARSKKRVPPSLQQAVDQSNQPTPLSSPTQGSTMSFDTDDNKAELASATNLDGLCVDMCSPTERELHIRVDELSLFEKCFPGQPGMEVELIVKRFQRSSADHKLDIPSEIRPPGVLRWTQLYLETNIMDREVLGPDPRFSTPREPELIELYNFCWDRTRMIRKDLVLQNYRGGGGRVHPIVLDIHERIARYHILSEHELCEVTSFVAQQNMEQLGQTLKSLNELYDESNKLGDPAYQSPFEAECRAYFILCTLDNGRGLDVLKFVKGLPKPILDSPQVKFAMKVFVARHTNDFFQFFKLLKEATYLVSCLMFRYIPGVRSAALESMNRAFRGSYTLEDLVSLLCFDDEDHAESVLTKHGIDVRMGDTAAKVKFGEEFYSELELRRNKTPLEIRSSHVYVGAKQGDYLRKDVCRGVTEYAPDDYPALSVLIKQFEDEERARLYPTRPRYEDDYSLFEDFRAPGSAPSAKSTPVPQPPNGNPQLDAIAQRKAELQRQKLETLRKIEVLQRAKEEQKQRLSGEIPAADAPSPARARPTEPRQLAEAEAQAKAEREAAKAKEKAEAEAKAQAEELARKRREVIERKLMEEKRIQELEEKRERERERERAEKQRRLDEARAAKLREEEAERARLAQLRKQAEDEAERKRLALLREEEARRAVEAERERRRKAAEDEARRKKEAELRAKRERELAELAAKKKQERRQRKQQLAVLKFRLHLWKKYCAESKQVPASVSLSLDQEQLAMKLTARATVEWLFGQSRPVQAFGCSRASASKLVRVVRQWKAPSGDVSRSIDMPALAASCRSLGPQGLIPLTQKWVIADLATEQPSDFGLWCAGIMGIVDRSTLPELASTSMFKVFQAGSSADPGQTAAVCARYIGTAFNGARDQLLQGTSVIIIPVATDDIVDSSARVRWTDKLEQFFFDLTSEQVNVLMIVYGENSSNEVSKLRQVLMKLQSTFPNTIREVVVKVLTTEDSDEATDAFTAALREVSSKKTPPHPVMMINVREVVEQVATATFKQNGASYDVLSRFPTAFQRLSDLIRTNAVGDSITLPSPELRGLVLPPACGWDGGEAFDRAMKAVDTLGAVRMAQLAAAEKISLTATNVCEVLFAKLTHFVDELFSKVSAAQVSVVELKRLVFCQLVPVHERLSKMTDLSPSDLISELPWQQILELVYGTFFETLDGLDILVHEAWKSSFKALTTSQEKPAPRQSATTPPVLSAYGQSTKHPVVVHISPKSLKRSFGVVLPGHHSGSRSLGSIKRRRADQRLKKLCLDISHDKNASANFQRYLQHELHRWAAD
ncbi:TPA: hypothetical protein N0F65_006536 [Lagenidium giganteum]|uniref:SAC3/GANP/THP3 conserved domain-containing protein n=1 Tax=Lagenidium giganteum TaxID=4803 RepID=A0AAV2YJS6_9STRA|nr:TPA: hypothetical protein N0F65_006536 [Lagenidium giganteum]